MGAILVVLGIAFYFVPAFVAGHRQHHNTAAIFVLNLLLGWTFLGWALSLVWALTTVNPVVSNAPRHFDSAVGPVSLAPRNVIPPLPPAARMTNKKSPLDTRFRWRSED